MKVYSSTYPDGWTEAQRVAAHAALTKDQEETLRQEWETPPDFWMAVNRAFDFELDVCASISNSKVEDSYISLDYDDDGLAVKWYDPKCPSFDNLCRYWCNPGFSDVLPWHKKAYAEVQKSASSVAVIIGIPGASQEWYAFAQQHADEIIDLSPRVHFLAPWPIKQSSNNRESMLFVYRRKVVPTRPATRTLWNWKEDL